MNNSDLFNKTTTKMLIKIFDLAHRCPSYQHFLLGRCFKCNTGNCAVMGYHATLPKIQSFNSSENEVIPSERDQPDNVSVAPGKYFLATGKDYPFCRKLCQQLYWFFSSLFSLFQYSNHDLLIINDLFLLLFNMDLNRASLSVYNRIG